MIAPSAAWSRMLAIACAALALIIGAELLLHYAFAPTSDDALPQQSQTTSPLQRTLRPTRSLDEFTAIIERPLFSPTRRPATGTWTTPSSTGGRASGLVLSGTIISTRRSIALVRASDSQDLHQAAVGDEIAGWIIEEIHADRIFVSSGGQTSEVPIWDAIAPPRQDQIP